VYSLTTTGGATPARPPKYEGDHRCPPPRFLRNCGPNTAPDAASRDALEAVDETAKLYLRWVGDQEVYMVGLAVELFQTGAEVGTHVGHDLAHPGEHLCGEYPLLVL